MIKPTDDEIKEFIELYADVIPDPKTQPMKFLFYWRVFKWKKGATK